MKKEEIVSIAQLLTAMKDGLAKLDDAEKENDRESVVIAKREILAFQKKLGELL